MSTELFKRLGIADQVKDKARRIEKWSASAPALVARGDAEIGFQQVSELLPIAGIDYVGLLPSRGSAGFDYQRGHRHKGNRPASRKGTHRIPASPAAAATIQKTGLETDGSADP